MASPEFGRQEAARLVCYIIQKLLPTAFLHLAVMAGDESLPVVVEMTVPEDEGKSVYSVPMYSQSGRYSPDAIRAAAVVLLRSASMSRELITQAAYYPIPYPQEP